MLSFFICFSDLYAQDANKQADTQTIRWSVTNNYSKSDKGQLLINLPFPAAALSCIVNKTGQANTFALRNGLPKELVAGTYDISFWGIKIPLVAVEKGKDTRILAGVLHSTVKGLWEVYTADGVKVYSAGGPKQVALPPGSYIVKTSGAEIKTTITDGKISIFSYTKY